MATQDPTARAWREVLDGFERALMIDDLPPDVRGRLMRCRTHVFRLLSERPLRRVETGA